MGAALAATPSISETLKTQLIFGVIVEYESDRDSAGAGRLLITGDCCQLLPITTVCYLRPKTIY
jgi:hypothetical protein